MITLAAQSDIDEIMALMRAAIQEMNQHGINQWDEIYPDETIIKSDILSKSLYKYVQTRKIVAIIAINNQGSPEYDTVEWSDKSDNYFVVHRLTVLPQYQGKGVAKQLMSFAEEFVLKNSKSSIRLDAFCNNPIAVNLYRMLLYTEIGTVEFRKRKFFCFEKLIRLPKTCSS